MTSLIECGMPLYTVSSTRLGSIINICTWSGVADTSSEAMMVFRQTDLPRTGRTRNQKMRHLSEVAKTASPVMSFPGPSRAAECGRAGAARRECCESKRPRR